jgi:hypothetical protein
MIKLFGQLSSAVKIIVFYNLSLYCSTLVALAQRLLFLETHKFSIFSFVKEKKIAVKENEEYF